MNSHDKFDGRLEGWKLSCPWCDFRAVIGPDTQFYMLIHHCPGTEYKKDFGNQASKEPTPTNPPPFRKP